MFVLTGVAQIGWCSAKKCFLTRDPSPEASSKMAIIKTIFQHALIPSKRRQSDETVPSISGDHIAVEA